MIKRILRASFLCFLLLFATVIVAQIETNPPMRQVIASGGGTAPIVGWGVTIDFTIGEAIITSESIVPSDDFPGFEWLTQGFQQPDNGLVVSTEGGIVNSSCKGGNNGRVTIKVINSIGLVDFTITGPASATISSIAEDSSAVFKDLAPGIYTYTAKDDKQERTGKFTIGENPIDCKLDQIYNGITANGDGVNDAWIIDSITHFNPNTVSIFNRWGNLVWKRDNYNNDDVVWKGTNNNGNDLPGGTYFYIIEAGAEIRKGWVEVTR